MHKIHKHRTRYTGGDEGKIADVLLGNTKVDRAVRRDAINRW